MTDHANELRRYSRKIGHPAGDVPSVMLAAADEIERLAARLEASEKERDALRAEIIHIKEVEFPRKAQAVADGWRGRCERLEAKIAKMEQQVPVAEWIENRFHQYPQLVWNKKYRVNIGDKLYALPGAKGEEK